MVMGSFCFYISLPKFWSVKKVEEADVSNSGLPSLRPSSVDDPQVGRKHGTFAQRQEEPLLMFRMNVGHDQQILLQRFMS